MSKFKIGDLVYYHRYGTELRVGYVQRIDCRQIWCNFQSFDELPFIHQIKKDGKQKYMDDYKLKLFIPKNINRRIIE